MSAEPLVSPHATSLSSEALAQLSRFKREVEEALPGQVARVTLFGSRARGDAEQDSDYDVAVFVHDDDWRLTSLVSNIAYPHMLEGVDISPVVLPAAYLRDDPPTELAAEIARDGIVLT